MQNLRYIFAVFGLTILALIIGIVLWNSEKSQTLSSNSGGDEVWSLGPQNAPVVIKTFPDFT